MTATRAAASVPEDLLEFDADLFVLLRKVLDESVDLVDLEPP